MLKSDFRYGPRELYLFQDLMTDRGMARDKPELRFRQFPRFSQDLRRDIDLANVVHKGSHLESVNHIL
jgi:hypothetical protein